MAAITIGGVLYLVASIAVAVFSRQQGHPLGKPINAEDVDQLLQCQADVESLFHDLTDQTFGLYARVGRKQTDIAQAWETFSRNWHDRWLGVGARCRFTELRDRGLDSAFDRLAYAHEALEDTELKFAAHLRDYIDHQVPHVEEIRRSLESSRGGLESRMRKLTRPPQAGAP
jgi:hypothetical protein